MCTEGAYQLTRAASLPSLLLPQFTACVSGQQVRTLEVLLFRILLFQLMTLLMGAPATPIVSFHSSFIYEVVQGLLRVHEHRTLTVKLALALD